MSAMAIRRLLYDRSGIDSFYASPRYELRYELWAPSDEEISVWQTPAPATPHIKAPIRIAGLRGRNLELVQGRVMRRLNRSGVRLHDTKPSPTTGRRTSSASVSEETALTIGLLLKTLAPMRNRERMLNIAAGIELMEKQEAAYWLGMAMHRRSPRTVLRALRVLLSDERLTLGGAR